MFEVITKGDFYCTAAAHYLHEELGAVRVFSTIGHREQKCSVVFQGEFFVCKTTDRVERFSSRKKFKLSQPASLPFPTPTIKSSTVNRLAARSVAVGKVPGLDHKIFYHAMENDALHNREQNIQPHQFRENPF